MSFWPQKLELKDLWVISLWSLIAWVIWSILLIVLVFGISSFLDIWSTFSAARTWAWELNSIFPLVLSVITFLVTSITVFITYFFLHFASPERYKKNIIILGQIAFFTLLTYIFMAPVYIYAGLIDYDYTMIVFIPYNYCCIWNKSYIGNFE